MRTIFAALLFCAVSAFAASGSLDPTFGTGGIRVSRIGPSNDDARALALQPDGKMVVVGESNGASQAFAIARYNFDGSLDASFGNGGKVLAQFIAGLPYLARGVALQADGKIVVAGYGQPSPTAGGIALARFNANGTLDTTFNGTGWVFTSAGVSSYASSVAVQADGKIVAAGYGTNGTVDGFALVRYNADGTTDFGFGTGGLAIANFTNGQAFANAIAIQADGRIVAAGKAHNGTNYDFAIARFNTNGTPDPAFLPNGKRMYNFPGNGDDSANAVAIRPDGRIIAAGSTAIGTTTAMAVIQLTTNGSPDTASFGANGTGMGTVPIPGTVNAFAYAVAVQADSKIVVAGIVSGAQASEPAGTVIARIHSNSAPDTSFATDGQRVVVSVSTVSTLGLAIAGDGSLVVATTADTEAGLRDFALARYLPNGAPDPAFNAGQLVFTDMGAGTVYGGFSGAWLAVARQLDGRIVASFGSGDIALDRGFVLARLNTDGSLDATFGVGGVASPSIPGMTHGNAQAIAIQGDGKIVATGIAPGSTDRFALARFNADGTLDADFGNGGAVLADLGTNGAIRPNALTLQPAGQIVAGGIDANNFALVRYFADGTLDTNFGSSGKAKTTIANGSSVRALALQSDGKIVAVGSAFSTSYDFAVARYSSSGVLDTSFGTAGKVVTNFTGTSDDFANAVAITDTGRIVVAGLSAGSVALARYIADGTVDSGFGTQGKVVAGGGEATAIALLPFFKIAVAGGAIANGHEDLMVQVFNGNGTPDTTFGVAGRVVIPIGTYNSSAFGMVIQPDATAIIAGSAVSLGPIMAAVSLQEAPAGLVFASQFNAPPSTYLTSNTITIPATSTMVVISVVNGEYGLTCNGGFSTGPIGITGLATTICVRHRSSNLPGDDTTTTLFVGSTAVTFTSVTARAATTSLVASSANPSSVEMPVTFTATVSGSWGTPTGLVTFRDSGHVIGTANLDASGQATLTTSSMPIGLHSVSAVYAGNGTYTSSSAPQFVQTVSGSALFVTTASSAATVAYGTLVTFTATLGPNPGDGELVVFKDAGNAIGVSTLANGQAAFATRGLSAGSHSITASFVPSGLYGATTSAAITQTVVPAGSSTVVGSNAATGNLGSPITFTAAVTGPGYEFGGAVAFKDGATTIAGCASVAVVNQSASCSTASLGNGAHAITAVYSGDGNNLPSSSAALAQPVTFDPLADADHDGIPNGVEFAELRDPLLKDNQVFTSARWFSMQQYRDFLAREGDAGGIDFYTSLLNAGTLVRANVIENFFNSPEFQGVGSPVARLYFATFLRIPDYPGLTFQIDAFRSGTPLAVVANNFTLSPEFTATYGALDNAHFVRLLYQNILGRTPSPGESDFYVNELTSGFTRGQVLVGFSESPEYQARTAHGVYVTMMYAGMLRRAPEQGGYDYWVAYMDAGNPGINLILGFLNAPEYHNRFLP